MNDLTANTTEEHTFDIEDAINVMEVNIDVPIQCNCGDKEATEVVQLPMQPQLTTAGSTTQTGR